MSCSPHREAPVEYALRPSGLANRGKIRETFAPPMTTAAPARKPATKFIFITLVLAITGFGLLIPVLPKLIVQFQGGDIAAGSGAYGWIISVYALMQFVFSPILGSIEKSKNMAHLVKWTAQRFVNFRITDYSLLGMSLPRFKLRFNECDQYPVFAQ